MPEVLARHAAPVATEMLAHFPGVVIEGARQVGKSTLAAAIAAPGAVLLTLDDAQTRAAAAADQAGFVAQAGERQLVIDEIQHVPELTLAVKASIDRDRRPGRFILTGSASLLRVRGTADSLAGRVGRLALHGLSRGEAAATPDDFVAAVIRDPAAILDCTSAMSRGDYAQLLAAGAYPEVRTASARIRDKWFDGYLQGVIGRDLPQLRREVRPARTMAVLRTLAGRQSAELVKATLAQETAVPASTITGYLDLLHDVGLVMSLPPWSPKLADREVGRPKTFVIDSGLAMWLARVTAEQITGLTYSQGLAGLLESFVAAELARQRTWSAHSFQLFHYRVRDKGEIDLIVELRDGSVIAIEVKSSTSFSRGDFKWLQQLRDDLGERFLAGIVLNTAATGYRYADRLWGAPIAALWELHP